MNRPRLVSLSALALLLACATAPHGAEPAGGDKTSSSPAAGSPAAASPGGAGAGPAAAAKPPEAPADVAPVTDGDVTFATVSGVQVLVKRIPSAELVAGHLYLRGGARNWGKADAGVELLALRVASEGGTETLGKEAFSRRLAQLGSTLAATTGRDYSSLRAKSIKSAWDDTFALLADSFLHPAMPAQEIEIQRQRQLAAVRTELEQPDARLGLLTASSYFKGHPYENRPNGNPESVAKLSAAQLSAHLLLLRQTGRLVMVVVGDVDPAHVQDQVRSAFGALPRGDYRETPLPRPSFGKPQLLAVAQKLPTNYLLGLFPAPTWGEPDLPAALVAMDVLNWREWEEVRTKRNLSYAPHAGMNAVGVGIGNLYVTAVDPNTTMKVMLDEARRLQTEPVPDAILAGNKSTFLTGFLMGNEATDGQAELLATAHLLGGDFRLARTLPERIRAVTAAEVQAFAKKYIGRLQVVAIGDPTKLDPAVFGSL